MPVPVTNDSDNRPCYPTCEVPDWVISVGDSLQLTGDIVEHVEVGADLTIQIGADKYLKGIVTQRTVTQAGGVSDVLQGGSVLVDCASGSDQCGSTL